MRTILQLLVVLGLLPLAACNGCGAQQARIAELEAQVAELEDAVGELEDRPTRNITVIQDLPAEGEDGGEGAPVDYAEQNKLTVTRMQVEESAEQLDEVDDDLADLEDEVDEQLADLDALDADVDALNLAINNHADLIEALLDDVAALREENERLLELTEVLSVREGAVVIDGADLVIQQDVGEDGMPTGNGRIYTQVDPRQGVVGR